MHPFKKVIIWGFPLYSHTHSFVHYGWYKAFKHLGFDTYWFHNKKYPEDFDFSECLFISEGYVDEKIPILPSSIYYIHICINPEKYLNKGARLIDLRHNLRFLHDYSYDYEMNKNILCKLSDCVFYENNASDLALREKYRKNIFGYEAIYMTWATDLLPEEINYDNINIPKENKVYNIGSIWHANFSEIADFEDECKKNGIEFIKRNPWQETTTIEENIELVQKSYIAPDIRGSGPISDECILERSNHLSTGYIPCRIFKNISYGQLGASNSWAVDSLFSGLVVYNSNVRQLFYEAQKERDNIDLIKSQMSCVKNNHTYINRVHNLLSIL